TSRGQRRPVSCAFELSGNRVSFRLGSYDPALPLVIDPTVLFNSYSGTTSSFSLGMGATYDAQGNMYSAGVVSGPGYPRTTGAYSQAFGGDQVDICLSKYNTTASGPGALVYATFIGGGSIETPHNLVTNPQGELVMVATTGSGNFPTTAGAYDRTFNGGSSIPGIGSGIYYQQGCDLALLKFSATGALQASTFFGGSGNDGILNLLSSGDLLNHNQGDHARSDVTLDAAGNVYVSSVTTSTDFPTTTGNVRIYRGGLHDATVSRFSPNLAALDWSTYLGGTGNDAARSLQLASDGSLYVCGGTTSANFPTSAGVLHPAAPGGVDGFVAQLSGATGALQRSTYLGTNVYDQAYFVQLDDTNQVYILGQTLGSYPITPGVYNNVAGTQFIQKLSADLSTNGFYTRFGSGRGAFTDIAPTAFGIDDCGRINVAGWGSDQLFGYSTQPLDRMPTTANAQRNVTDGCDLYFLQLAPGATALTYASYYGYYAPGINLQGEHVDAGAARFDRAGNLYHSSCGGCGNNFPMVAGSYYVTSRVTSGACNQTSIKVQFGEVSAGPAQQTICSNAAPITLTGAVPTGGVWSGPGVTQVGSSYVFTPSAALIGSQTLTYTVPGQLTCAGTATRTMVVQAVTAASFGPLDPAFCISQTTSTLLTASPPGGTFSGPGVAGNLFYPAAAGLGTHIISYTVPATPCAPASTVTRTVQVGSALTVRVRQDTAICQGNMQPIVLSGADPVGGVWSGVGVSQQGSRYVFTPPATPGSYALTYAT
ncbi:hypothetical protein LJY25_21120, partial [Hymenobacter sp. BT175]|nr:hypothetical protein [Hymenobacter translucens]